jgi:hypothetical protein
MLWSEKLIDFVGLPRPFFYSREVHWFRNGESYMYKKVPVPYQSMPGIVGGSPIRLNIKNEKKVVEEGLCSYCGVKVEDNEVSIRWMIEKVQFGLNNNRDFVPSDFHPLHLKCMKQARIYCPFMRKLKDEDFDIRLNKDNTKIAKENFDKFFVIQWENRVRLP